MSDGHDHETGELLPVETRQPRSGGQLVVPLASPSCAQVWGALAIAQGGFEPPKRTKEAKIDGITASGGKYSYTYKYAPLEELERVIRTPLAQNGLFRQQYLVSRDGQWFIRTMIGHSSGEWIACDYPIFVAKQGAQGFASGVTYARRYGLSLALGLSPEDDDDAQVADNAVPATDGSRQHRPPPIREPGTIPYDPELGAVPVSRPADSLPETQERTRRTKAEIDVFLALAGTEAAKGSESFRAWFKTLTPNNRALLRPGMAELQRAAEEADAHRAAAGDGVELAAEDEAGDAHELPADVERELAAELDRIAPRGDGAGGGGPHDAGEPQPRDPFWQQPRLYQGPVTIGDRQDWDATKGVLLGRIGDAADTAELMRFASDSRRTIDGVRLNLKSTVIQTAIASRLAELPDGPQDAA